MKITDIKRQIKRQDRYSIYRDGKYLFSLSETELLTIGLKIGQEFNQAELEQLKQTALLDKAYDRALNLIARRPRSTWEIQDYLKRKSYESEIIDQIVNKLNERGMLSDLRFARAWVENRRLLKPSSRRKLTMELRQKRVPDEVVEQVLAEDEASDLSVLRELVERKRKRYPDKLKLMQYLSRQGFGYDDIKTVLEETD